MVGFQVKMKFNSTFLYGVGNGEFLGSFFDTIAYRLENGKRGSKYPIFNCLYLGNQIDYKNLFILKKELEEIQKQLKRFSPQDVVWDMEDLTKQPPWGNNISKEITNLSNYFVTSRGNQLFDVLNKAIDHAISLKSSIKIVSTFE